MVAIRLNCIIALGCLLPWICNAQDCPASSPSGHISCLPGTLRVILAAPHGGDDMPLEIPDRDAGCYEDGACVWSHNCADKDFVNCAATTVKDSNTRELTEALRTELHKLTGKYPTAVINKLHRRKLDANRDKAEATFGIAQVEQAWDEFHSYINQSKQAVQGPALFLDIHGHGHVEQLVELGYLISGRDLDDGNFSPEQTSILALSQRKQA